MMRRLFGTGKGISTYILPARPGNLTYDGTYAYHYDAWNRLVAVAKAFRESTPDGNGGVTLGSLQEGSTVHLSSYDGLNRRTALHQFTDADGSHRYDPAEAGETLLAFFGDTLDHVGHRTAAEARSLPFV